ncbi:MAG TPA: biopolymer transporter ExbD [Polyangiaceae bacterium]|nr:biopolymer transporter ExbD [Polyangiaceae bacterium]
MAGTTKSGGGRRAPIAEINVTPMVDVMLVLLVIMIVSAQYIVSQSIKVELPKAASASDSVASVAAVTLSKDGKTYYNQEPISEPDLISHFKSALAGNKDLNLIVSADKEVPHGKVVHVIDLAKLEGITKFAINVELQN